VQVAELQAGLTIGLERAVQEADVRGIVVAFVRLQVVALDEHFRRMHMLLGVREKIVIGKLGRFALTHVGEERARPLDHRIGPLTHLGLERAVLRLRRLFQTAARDVV